MRTALPLLVGIFLACEPGTPDAGNTLSPAQAAQEWLDAHNAVRRAPQPPPPEPLPPLTWSDGAAGVAQSWAAGCNYRHNAGRGDRGENIAATTPSRKGQISDVVTAWASEAADYDYSTNTCAAGKECGHYTQLVWASTLRVGCAHQVCTSNSPFGSGNPNWDFWVCDYEPPGNFIGQKPY
jgi:uncharacterized protein YkwD